MLDVKATDKGILVPRMTTTQRTSISSPANGLLVFDSTTGSFWFYQNSKWTELRAGNIPGLSDADGDTKVEVEETTDEDIIRFYSKDVNSFSMDSMRIETGNNSVFLGRASGAISLYYNTGGSFNTAVGFGTLFKNTTGTDNCAYGALALHENLTGNENVAFGRMSMMNSTSGSNNTAFGSYTLYINSAGYDNTAIGMMSLYNNKIGSRNTAIGSYSLQNNKKSHYNVAIGYNSCLNDTSGFFQLNIGNLIYGTDVDGTGNTISTGNIGIGVQYPQERLHVDGKIRMDYISGVSWTTYVDGSYDYNFDYNGTLKAWIDDADGSYHSVSDKQLKAGISPINNMLTTIVVLQPVTYYMKGDDTQTEKIGMIAQDVEKYFPQAVSEKNGTKTLNYAVFGMLAIEALKEQQKEIDGLKQRLEKLEKIIMEKQK